MIEAIADLETWGIRATSVVRSVGLVVFDGPTVLERHYFRISEAEQLYEQRRSDGVLYSARTTDKSTRDWWAKPENANAEAMIEQAKLVSWEEGRTICGKIGDKVKNIWAKPASFDLVMLRDLFGQDIWRYSKERDLSTLLGEFDPTRTTQPRFEGTPHNALHDAEHGRTWLIGLRRAIPMIVELQNRSQGGKIWECKIGEMDALSEIGRLDFPMRQAVQEAYKAITGQDPKFLFSGWGGRLTHGERNVAVRSGWTKAK